MKNILFFKSVIFSKKSKKGKKLHVPLCWWPFYFRRVYSGWSFSCCLQLQSTLLPPIPTLPHSIVPFGPLVWLEMKLPWSPALKVFVPILRGKVQLHVALLRLQKKFKISKQNRSIFFFKVGKFHGLWNDSPLFLRPEKIWECQILGLKN